MATGAVARATSRTFMLNYLPNAVSKGIARKPISSSPFSVFSRPILFEASRILSALESDQSMKPLHSAISSARLKSCIAFDSSSWSWLSQDFAIPR